MLFAVHLSDGVVSGPWLLAGWGVAAVLVAVAAWGVREDEVPRIGVMTAAMFVASQFHLPLVGVSVHLLLNGLVGVVLGKRSALAVAVGLFLQAVLFGHGGWTTLGLNVSVYAIPATIAGVIYAPVRRSGLLRLSVVRWAVMTGGAFVWMASAAAGAQWIGSRFRWTGIGVPATLADWWLVRPEVAAGVLVAAVAVAWLERRLEADPEFAVGAVLGGAAAYQTVALNCTVLAFGGTSEVRDLAGLTLLQLPVVLIESVGVGFVVAYLARAKPEWLGGRPPLDHRPAGSGNTSSNGTSH